MSDLKHCSKCRSAKYCGTSCQQNDWSRHKKWCRAAQDAKKCERCAEFPSDKLIIHGDGVRLEGSSPRDFFSNHLPFPPHTPTILMYHAPFSQLARTILGIRIPNHVDTLFWWKGGIHTGTWSEHFGKEQLSRLLSKGAECCVCLEVPVSKQISCGTCSTMTCWDCAKKLDGTHVVKTDVQMFWYQCPVCREGVPAIW